MEGMIDVALTFSVSDLHSLLEEEQEKVEGREAASS